jgi:hypothetical protein
MINYKDHLVDERVNCYSILMTIKIEDYLKFVEEVYKNKGSIEGQRSPLKTKSAQRIRRRLIDDLIKGTVIPPIVIGVKLDNKDFDNLTKNIPEKSLTLLDRINKEDQVSIIDGMQRTTALIESLNYDKFDKSRLIRLELWVAKSTNSLIYRMLVLNSGQIPWNIKRQLEVVFSQLKNELETNIAGLELFTSDDPSRRVSAGQYQASQFIELFMLFGAKRTNIDLQEELAEEFARLDIIETSGNEEFMQIFYGVSQLLVNLDAVFSSLNTNTTEIELNKFKIGRDIFSSQPARAGFIVAMSQDIFGLPGVEFTEEKQLKKYSIIKEKLDLFFKKVKDFNQKELFNLIDLPTLDEQINIKSSKVGEFERNFFLKSFKTMIDLAKDDSLLSFTPSWRTSH